MISTPKDEAVKSLKLMYKFLFSKEKTRVIIIFIIVCLSGVIPSIDGILLQQFTNLIESFPEDKLSTISVVLFKWVLIYALWWEGLNWFWRAHDYFYLKAMPNIKAQVVDELYDHVQYHDHHFFQSNLAGDITNKIVEASRSLEMVFAIFSEHIVRKVAVLFFVLVTMYSVHHTVGNIMLIWLLWFVGISLLYSRQINDYSTEYGLDKALVAGKLVDSIANISAIRMFTSHRYEKKYLNRYVHKTIVSDQKMQWFMFKLRYVLGLSCTLMIFAMLYYILYLRSKALLTIGDCVLIITLCIAVIDEFWDLTQDLGDLFEQVGSFNQALSIIDRNTVNDLPNAQPIRVITPSIEFRKVTFFYHNNKNIFKNKSIIIPAEQRVGLVGFSGSGKTTFAALICRLFDIESGQILIDGQDIKTVTQDSLRQNISVIPQEPILFHRTIMENIRYGKKEATDEEVYAAAKAAYIHDHITELSDGYNTLCGERGNNLSGGQRQRVIIARAMLKNAPILILDEATSALDSHTEALIQKALYALMKGKTVLVIAHRLSTLLAMDRLLVFDNGYIVEDGTHRELKNNGKLYQKLWKSQVEGIISENP